MHETVERHLQIHRGLDNLPKFKKAVVTIGSYDGLHHGHRQILSRLIEVAKEKEGESIIITFNPHPRQVVFPNDKSLKLLNPPEEKIHLLEEVGVDHLVIIPFTIAFSQINPYDYVDKILIEKISVHHIIIGYDHKFGLNRAGDINLLNLYAEKGLFTVEEISKQAIDDLHVSSTQIRNYIVAGDMLNANKLLVKPFRLTGKVTQGQQLAGPLGYPTANCTLNNPDKILPLRGSYAATAICGNVEYKGMLYIGESKTLKDSSQVAIEINLFAKIEEPLYGKKITIFPLQFIRGDQKFNSKEELLYNIAGDKIDSLLYFSSQSEAPKVTTAILNYNGASYLEKFLPSHQTVSIPSHETVLIDNASTDESIKITKSNFPQIRIVSLPENQGFAGGYNEGLQEVHSKYTAIVNSDIEVTSDWLTPLIEALEKDDSLAAVQPKILSYHQKESFEYAGAAGGFLDAIGYPYCRGRILDTVESDDQQYDSEISTDWTSGAAMVIRTDLFKRIGAFDTTFFAHMEEIDLCWRLRRAGYTLKCIPSSVVYHVGGGTLDYMSSQKAYLNLRNNYWMIFKNWPSSKFYTRLPLRLGIDFCYSLKLILSGKVGMGLSACKGTLQGIIGNKTIRKNRRNFNYYLKRYNKEEIVTSSKLNALPFTYFILGKKKYKDLHL